jgi:hypothetical protein
MTSPLRLILVQPKIRVVFGGHALTSNFSFASPSISPRGRIELAQMVLETPWYEPTFCRRRR